MYRTNRKQAYQLRFILLGSYMAALLLPLIVGIVSYAVAGNIVQDQAMKSTQVLIGQLSSTVDSHLDGLNSLAYQVLRNPKVKSLLAAESSNVPYPSMDDIALLLDDFAAYRTISPIIDNFFLYLVNRDIIIAPSFYSTPQHFYSQIATFDLPLYQWKNELLRGYYESSFLGTRAKVPFSDTNELIVYAQSLSFPNFGVPYANLMILIRASTMRSLISRIAELNNGEVFILDRSGESIISVGSIEGFSKKLSGDVLSKRGTQPIRIDGKNWILSLSGSYRLGITYGVAFPREEILKNVRIIGYLTILVTVSCLLIGSAIAAVVFFRMYNPIQKLVTMVLEKEPQQAGTGADLATAEQKVSWIFSQEKQLRKLFEEHWPVYRSTLLIRLLKGKYDRERIQQDLKLYEIRFDHDQFCVVLFVQDNVPDDASEQKRILLNEALRSAFANRGWPITETEDGFTALILNTDTSSAFAAENDDIRSFLQDTKRILSMKGMPTIAVVIGGIKQGIEGIQASYREADKAVDYRIVMGPDSIIFADEHHEYQLSYYYPLELEGRLITSVKTGDIDSALLVLENVFDQNFKSLKLPLKLLKCLFFDLLSTGIKILDSVEMDIGSVFGKDNDPIDLILGCETAEEARAVMTEIYSAVCLKINERKKSHNDRLRIRIEDYINSNLTDSGLSQVQIADEIGISPTYLSHFFHEQTGERMVEYIARLRVAKAEKLLVDESLNLQSVAKFVGYNTDIALTRAFKRFTGMTPGEFRKRRLGLE